jgi:putative ABC transport system permease protein
VSSFAVIAGLLLILNIFTMLADERKRELAISRAVGLRRRDLVRLFLYEGTMYAVVAAALGTLAGLGLALAMIWAFNNVFTGTFGLPQIPLHVDAASLLLAFALGVLLTLGTVWLAARRSSRLNIVRAIRELEEPEILRGGWNVWAALVLMALGLLGSIWGLVANSFAGQVLGPLMLAVGLAVGLRRHFPRRVVYPAVSLLLFVYYTVTLFLITEYDQETGNIFGPLRAIAMAGCVVVVVLYSERATRGAAWVLGRFKALRPVAIPATAYPLHKKFRTGMTLLMFAVILLMVSLFSIFGNLFLTEPERETGGYHVRGFSTQEVSSLDGHGSGGDALADVVHVDVLPEFFKLGGDIVRVSGQETGHFGPPRDAVWGMDAEFAANNGFQLVFRHPDYPTDEAAYRAVAERDDVVIVSYHYSTSEQGEDFAHDVGETLTLSARGTTSEFTIVGIQQQFHFKGIFVRQDVVGRLFTNTDTMFLFQIEDPAAAEDVAKRLEASYRDIGLDAADLRQAVLEEQEQFRRLLSMVQLFLGLGLVVGILSLGIVTARNVVERRQEIGMLRALGFRRAHVRRAFLLETLGTITLGVVIGAFVAILVSYGLWVALLQDLDVAFSVPWGELAAIAVVAYVATILATLSPIFRAARTPPAEALRYIE